MEKWKNLTSLGFSNYDVSDLGRIRRHLKDGKYRIRNNSSRKNGYEVVRLINKNFRVHRLVAMMFVEGRSKDRDQVNHINGIKDDNRHFNLQWVTGYENCDHAQEVLKKGSISIPVVCFDNQGDKIAEFTSKSLARKWGFKPSDMMESSVYSKEAALLLINKPRKKYEMSDPNLRSNKSFENNVPDLLKHQVLLDIKNGSLIKDIVDKYGLSRYKIDIILKSSRKK